MSTSDEYNEDEERREIINLLKYFAQFIPYDDEHRYKTDLQISKLMDIDRKRSRR